MFAEGKTQVWDLGVERLSGDTPGRPGHAAGPQWIACRQLCTDAGHCPGQPVDMLCIAANRPVLVPSECQRPTPTMVTWRRNRWSRMKEQGRGKATRIQVAGLWIAACSLGLALLRTVFDVLEAMGQ